MKEDDKQINKIPLFLLYTHSHTHSEIRHAKYLTLALALDHHTDHTHTQTRALTVCQRQSELVYRVTLSCLVSPEEAKLT